MSRQDEAVPVSRYLPGVMIPLVALLWVFVAMGSNADGLATEQDGRYRSSGHVMLSDGRIQTISQSLVLDKHRFQSLLRSATVTVEATGRVERDAFGRIRLLVDERHVSGASEEELDDELIFNLLFGRHRGSQVNLKQVGPCLYGIETRKTYCRDDNIL